MKSKSRKRSYLEVGDIVALSSSMSVEGYRTGIIESINGSYIYVSMLFNRSIIVERYISELEKL